MTDKLEATRLMANVLRYANDDDPCVLGTIAFLKRDFVGLVVTDANIRVVLKGGVEFVVGWHSSKSEDEEEGEE